MAESKSISLPVNVHIETRERLGEVLVVNGKSGSAEIALHGATVISFNTAPVAGQQHPVLWLSPKASGENARAIRGGIPLCAPWFGPHPTAGTAPQHGLARNAKWTLLRVETETNGLLRADFDLDLPRDARKGWNHSAKAFFSASIGSRLKLELTVRNTGAESFLLSEAMHSYFSVSDVRQARVEGLENAEYLDFSGDGMRHEHGDCPVSLSGEAAHMFYKSGSVRIVDPAWKRAIVIRSSGTQNTVVWNPWAESGGRMGEVGDAWPGFLCVEAANLADVAIPLPPDTSHHMACEIAMEELD